MRSSPRLLPGSFRHTAQIIVLVAAFVAWDGCTTARVRPATEAQASTATLEWLDQQYGLVYDRPLERLLHKITGRLSGTVYGSALETDLSREQIVRYRELPWQVFVMREATPNAFSLGAGAVVVTSGMLLETRSEAELAAVIAHEMAHQLLGHTTSALEKQRQTGAPAATFSLEDELAADRLGLKLLFVGRYQLSEALSAIAIGRQLGGESLGPDWLTLRMANLHQELDQYPQHLPATESSREFNRVRRHLALGRASS
ncbi:MAG: M48 family metalloprotease [Bdellovibrionales bacterium]|nr:M48 family metalloprotease [Bdellovibrionales bacterium]